MTRPGFNQRGEAEAAEIDRLKRDVLRIAQAEQSAYQRVEEAEAEATRWRRRARLALERGDEDLARQALARASRYGDRAAEARAGFAELSAHVAQLKRQLRYRQQAVPANWRAGAASWRGLSPWLTRIRWRSWSSSMPRIRRSSSAS